MSDDAKRMEAGKAKWQEFFLKERLGADDIRPKGEPITKPGAATLTPQERVEAAGIVSGVVLHGPFPSLASPSPYDDREMAKLLDGLKPDLQVVQITSPAGAGKTMLPGQTSLPGIPTPSKKD